MAERSKARTFKEALGKLKLPQPKGSKPVAGKTPDSNRRMSIADVLFEDMEKKEGA